ncbi:MAG: exosortase X [Janthinobacterium lividum]
MTFRLFRSLAPPVRFGLLALALYLLWVGGYEHYLAADGRLDAVLSHNLAHTSGAVLRGLGFEASVSDTLIPVISLAQQPVLRIWPECNGLVLYALFGGFIVAFVGPVRSKLWFVPLGMALIYCLNVVRLVALCLNAHYAHQTVEFNHHYTFTFLVYASIFGLWMWWAARLAQPRPSASAYSV